MFHILRGILGRRELLVEHLHKPLSGTLGSDTVSPRKAIAAADLSGARGHVMVWKTDAAGKKTLLFEGDNDFTAGGIDWLFAQLYTNTTAGTRGANFLALSNDSADTTTTDTTFPGELNTNGISRVDVSTQNPGAITHVLGTNTTVLQYVFTATGAVANIHKAALFESATATRPIHVYTFPSDTTLATTERLTVAWSITFN